MRRSRWPGVARQLQNEVSDGDLLERYVQGRDDDAFAQLLTRYSRLVWGQCRNLLTDDADADDAFQAVFLTLARSARTIRPGAPLGPWLHGVAFRVCKNARRANGRRTKRERATALPESNRPVADSTWEVAFAAVAEEVQKLPEAQRAAFILCCIEGRATTEAAASLGQKLGTFSARLTRAKQTLLNRLAKRGIGAGVLALGGITGISTVAPAALIVRTLALIPSGVAVPGSILTLTHGVTGMMLIRLKLLAAGVLVATGFGLSVGGGWSSSVEAQGPGPGGPGGIPPGGGSGPPGFGGGGRGGPGEGGEAPPPAKAPPKPEQLKAELEKAKADYERGKLLYDSLMDKKRKQESAEQYAYDDVPKEGLRAEDLQARLSERRKTGWSFLGQVSLNVGEASPKQYLAFHKPGRAPAGGMFPGGPGVMGGGGPAMGMPGGSGMSMPPGGMPSLPPATTTIPGGSGVPFGSGLADSAGLPGAAGNLPGSAAETHFSVPSTFIPASPMSYDSVPPPRFTQSRPRQPNEQIPEDNFHNLPSPRNHPVREHEGPEVINEIPIPAGSEVRIPSSPPDRENRTQLPTPTISREKLLSKKTEAEYEAKIAALEKQVQTLLADTSKVFGDPHGFNANDYGNWDPKELVEVLRKVMADETVEYKLFKDHFQATGTPESLVAVSEWVKKLKKDRLQEYRMKSR